MAGILGLFVFYFKLRGGKDALPIRIRCEKGHRFRNNVTLNDYLILARRTFGNGTSTCKPMCKSLGEFFHIDSYADKNKHQ